MEKNTKDYIRLLDQAKKEIDSLKSVSFAKDSDIEKRFNSITNLLSSAQKIATSTKKSPDNHQLLTISPPNEMETDLDGTIPFLPLSNLHRFLLIERDMLDIALLAYDTVTNDTNSSLSQARMVIENKRIAQSKVSEIEHAQAEIQQTRISAWKPERLALQIAKLDCLIFEKIGKLDIVVTKLADVEYTIFTSLSCKRLIDFHIFIERIIIDALVSEHKPPPQPQTHNSSASQITSEELRSKTTQVVIHTAFHLFHIYRDLNATYALLKALNSPQVVRLERSWDHLPIKTKEMYKQLSILVPLPESPNHRHITLIHQLLATHYKANKITVIPFLLPLLDEFDLISQAYVTGHQIDLCGRKTDILTDIGARALDSIFALVTACQGRSGKPDENVKNVIKRLDESGGMLAGLELKLGSMPSVPVDLANIQSDFPKIEHWLLTRVFWNRSDLWQKSVESRKLGIREVIPEFFPFFVRLVDEIYAEKFKKKENILENEVEGNGDGDEKSINLMDFSVKAAADLDAEEIDIDDLHIGSSIYDNSEPSETQSLDLPSIPDKLVSEDLDETPTQKSINEVYRETEALLAKSNVFVDKAEAMINKSPILAEEIFCNSSDGELFNRLQKLNSKK